ncbi:MAG: hypothetical protein ABTQ73_01910, partial [Caldilineales bacterium]
STSGYRLGEANALIGLGEAARRQDRTDDARVFFQQAFELYLAIGLPQEALRFALSNAKAALDQAAETLARWLLTWADQAYQRTDSTVAAQYNPPLQALRLRLGDQPGEPQSLFATEAESRFQPYFNVAPPPQRKPIRQLKIKTRRSSP